MTSLQQYALIALGGALGSCARYRLGSFIASRWGTAFPWGTFAVNVTGSIVIGAFLAVAGDRLHLDPRWRFFLAIGFCGGYTTFSTFTYETAMLIEARALGYAVANVALSSLAGVLGVFGGAALARRLWL